MFKGFNELITPAWCTTYYYGYKKSIKDNVSKKEVIIDKAIYKKTFLMQLLVFLYDFAPLIVILAEANIAVIYDLSFPIMPFDNVINVLLYIIIWLALVFLIRAISIRIFGLYMKNKQRDN